MRNVRRIDRVAILNVTGFDEYVRRLEAGNLKAVDSEAKAVKAELMKPEYQGVFWRLAAVSQARRYEA